MKALVAACLAALLSMGSGLLGVRVARIQGAGGSDVCRIWVRERVICEFRAP